MQYFDASALARRYVHEPGSTSVRRQLRTGRIATSRLSAIEITSALARREREGGLTTAERDRAVRTLNTDLAAYILVELTAELSTDAQALLLRHPLRSGDTVQLASCLYLQRETGERISFAACDERLNNAARAEGLTLTDLS
ncbi:MAG: type II toxin-antitoxin system VapC family toxin [Vicinamibacterales bacterium]